MSENSDNHIRFNSTNMVVFCKEYKDLEKNPVLASQDMRAAQAIYIIAGIPLRRTSSSQARSQLTRHDRNLYD